MKKIFKNIKTLISYLVCICSPTYAAAAVNVSADSSELDSNIELFSGFGS